MNEKSKPIETVAGSRVFRCSSNKQHGHSLIASVRVFQQGQCDMHVVHWPHDAWQGITCRLLRLHNSNLE